jgi:hypothetical protein
MSVSSTTGGRSRSLILTAMIFAVAMTFIDQTIVSIPRPRSSATWACRAADRAGPDRLVQAGQ